MKKQTRALCPQIRHISKLYKKYVNQGRGKRKKKEERGKREIERGEEWERMGENGRGERRREIISQLLN